MRILHVIWHLSQGGAQTYLLNLLKVQAQDDEIEPVLLVLNSAGELSGNFEEIVEVVYINMRSGLDLTRSLGFVRLARGYKPDLIHSHSNNLAFNVLKHLLDVPVVYTEHGGGLLGGRIRDRLLYRFLSRPICRLIAISREMERVMLAANRTLSDRIVVVHNGVDAGMIECEPVHSGNGLDRRVMESTYRVGIIGRLEDQKGIDLFIETAGYIAAALDDVVFIIIGDGSLRSELEEQAKALGVRDKVFFLGYRTDAINLLKLFDIFLFTSSYEPFGLVITEAMAAGVPVLAAHRKGAVPEIINSGENGIVVEGRRPAEMAVQARKLLLDKDMHQQIADSARSHVGKYFSFSENAAKVKSIYKECL